MTDPFPRDHPAEPAWSTGELSRWGFDAKSLALARAVAGPGDLPGRVTRADARSCLVRLAGGERQVPVARRLLGPADERPTTGDFVLVRGGELAVVLERRSTVVRASPDPGRGAQTLAANVDTVLVVEPLGERWRPRRLERLLVAAWQSGALPVVVLTKADQADDLPAALSAATAVAPGAAVLAVSARTGEGMGALSGELASGSTTVVIGRSGAGKSTLANVLSGGAAGLSTGEVRPDGKGRHTTIARELVMLANGALMIDTPGLRALGLVDAGEAIEQAFSEIEELAAGCRFRDCSHGREPGCAVLEAISSGALAADRLAGYQRLQREQARLEAMGDKRLQAERAARWRRLAREVQRLPRR